jgi:LysR family glycine cleavage system transcriptional activator
MKRRKNMPLAALRAFEAAARHGRLTAAAEELAVTHGAISRHVSHLEDFIGTPLFEGARNRPKLTAEGRVFGSALTEAFDRIDAAMRTVSRGDDGVLNVACLSTFAMRWLIPRLHDFVAKHPSYDVRLATDDRPQTASRDQIDVHISVLPPEMPIAGNAALLFDEYLGLVAAPSLVGGRTWPADGDVVAIPRLETRTRAQVWSEWSRLSGLDEGRTLPRAAGIFDHYHLTIEAALNGLGAAVVPWHLIAEEIRSGRLLAPSGFRKSDYRYVVDVSRPGRRKTVHFITWLKEAVAAFPQPPNRSDR